MIKETIRGTSSLVLLRHYFSLYSTFSVLVNIPCKECFWKKKSTFLKKRPTFPWVEISVAMGFSPPPELNNPEKGTELSG